MPEYWKFFVRSLVSCHQDELLERFIAEPAVRQEIEKFEAALRNHWQQVMGPVPKIFVMPDFGEAAPAGSTPATREESQASAAALPFAAEATPAVAGAETVAPRPDAVLDHPPAPLAAATLPVSEVTAEDSMLPAAPALPEVLVQPVAALLPPPCLKQHPVLKFKLVNGRQSEAFAEELECVAPRGEYRLIDVEIPPELGLVFDQKTSLIRGKPAASGDFMLRVRYRHSDDPPEAIREAPLNFYVNPDPKRLWRDLPSNRKDPLWKADEAAQMLVGPERRVVAARKRGRSHAHVGSCCDDDFVIHHDAATDWYVAVVADGAGSAAASRHGSELAVRAAAHHIRQALAGDDDQRIAAAVAGYLAAAPDGRDHAKRILHNALYVVVGYAAHRAMKALVDEAQARPTLIRSVRDLATTLLVGITKKFGDQWLCAAYWVGDGAVGVYRKGAGIELLGEVDSGEYSGQTRFLDNNEVTQEALFKRTRFTLCPDFTAFLLMTDGVSDPKFETEARLGELLVWDALWADLQTAVCLAGENPDIRLLEWLDFWSQGNHDDRTIAIIY